ncbi:MAG: polyhydroxyalkanoate synthesis repressor PhaR [Alphaproteobacteria bacterium]|jgi:polyhydroxyalkanoate synthesis repressor PhaR|nr:polyhydroxyalkanoate synthesis repressor PhaR [Alphaproteobacteria bacterium]MDP6875174.1 polyhydroxyalkanoate synthesis repressor PhaR [Alphaproteobacteria bacterium]
MVDKSSTSEDTIVIKKYANRRLYNTATSSYVTLDTLCTMVKEGQDFVVQDAKSGDDITRSVLTQIIFEEESKGQNLLPISFLRQLIGFYGDSLQTMVPGYLESTMSAFAHNQEQIRQHLQQSMGDTNPFRQMEELGRQNMAMFQQAMGMFTPFANKTADGTGDGPRQPSTAAAPEPAVHAKHGDTGSNGESGGGEELDLLRQQLAQMQQQLDNLSNKS